MISAKGGRRAAVWVTPQSLGGCRTADGPSDSGLGNAGAFEQPLPAIHAAVRNLDVDALRRALAAGANVDALDESGRTPLYVACMFKSACTIGHDGGANMEGIFASARRLSPHYCVLARTCW